ncbi:1-(5-phosphoribosyl)-5-((5-phosphoribosylamino)methylideneamino) imidazole-4-carboxamide isomerase [Desulfitobacterium dichloroeliminans LMG P-21439]|uniref:1-(5-phosphoribosyl)-5-[(5-phosphoribosylamino)methylideneamino] imidazole-4-carboxamide isomerase n=1 Tax=Desulfitobacterium dichloroeliminans (strain LMG P-21439 / DCA1) TaxID=871963 RepID=L0F7W5_DESDL|nr:1-(5-phosphoribosyl)-5-[(5-phosphoribosylamino)methylideneamino]imidazole-4-carboxamide isomerase [Desulfitobacterium dichloroeliminans]AGA68751.1 1-(5-phosphoribosyl)-5-((5-phosphoribosylamino)methylideneamino) imidazole-4-carboxamide isomerase [Desulfitobacterium dichloroeliminans LMG P-21439]
MRIFPAIDLKGGKAVRLLQGRMEDATVYSENPVEVARDFKAQGADSLHVVDLDGAFAGQPVNDLIIRQLIQSSGLKVQVGGGIRSLERIEELLNLGVERVILGTVAVRNPELVQQAVARFGEAIVVGIDAKDGQVAVQGWAEKTELEALELALKMKEVGVKHLVFTDISRDGMLQGPNIQSTVELARVSGLQVVASGGVSHLEDIILLQKEANQGVPIAGAIIGKALYTGAIALSAALAVTASSGNLFGVNLNLENDREGDGC